MYNMFMLTAVNCPGNTYGWDCTQRCYCKNPDHCERFTGPTAHCRCQDGYFNEPFCEPGKMSRLMTKPTKWHVRPAKTQISLDIHPVWSESSLSAWRKLGSLATHWAHSEDSDQTGRMTLIRWADAQADLSLRWAHTHFVNFVMRQLKLVLQHYVNINELSSHEKTTLSDLVSSSLNRIYSQIDFCFRLCMKVNSHTSTLFTDKVTNVKERTYC